MKNSTNLTPAMQKLALKQKEAKAKKDAQDKQERAERRMRKLNHPEANLTNKHIAHFKSKTKTCAFKSYTSHISIRYADMDTEMKLYHFLTVMVKNADLQILDALCNMPIAFHTQLIIDEMYDYFTAFFTVKTVDEKGKEKESIEPRAVINVNWEAYILTYPKIAKSLGLERWFHYLIYTKPAILDESQHLAYQKKYIALANLAEIELPLDDYQGYTELEMYKHWIQCLRKDAHLLIEDARAYLPMRYVNPFILKYMAKSLSEWFYMSQADDERWMRFIKYSEKIQNATGLELLLHYAIYKKREILPKAKLKDYQDVYYKTSAKLAFKASHHVLNATSLQSSATGAKRKRD